MFFLEVSEVDRQIRQLRNLYGSVDEGLRGWNWSSDLLSPPLQGVYLGVSEVANRYCPTYRDIYLRRVLSRPAPFTYKTVRGWVYHAVCKKVVERAKSKLYTEGIMTGPELYSSILMDAGRDIERIVEEHRACKVLGEVGAERLRREAETLYRFLALQAASRLDRVLSRTARPDLESLIPRVVAVDVERVVNGQLLGLSGELRVDMLADRRIVVEIKTGDARDFHKYVVAGYALAVESDSEIPIDYGIVSYIAVEDRFVKIRNRIYFIGDELRRGFLEMRDEAFETIRRGIDPGKPPECPDYCVYYGECA